MLLLAALLISADAAQKVDTVDCRPVLGSWTGTGTQLGAGQWSIEWTMTGCGLAGVKVGEVKYPSLDCGGDLFWVGYEAGVFIVEERIEGGNCVESGTIRLTPQDGKLDWQWFWPITGKLGATSTLTKKP